MGKISKKIDDKIGMGTVWVIVIVFMVMILVTIIVGIITEANQFNSQRHTTTYNSSSSSSTTDWDAYCRDMFPDSPSAQQGCKNGANATDNLMNGKYDR